VAVAWSSSRGACSGEAEEKAREREEWGWEGGGANGKKKENDEWAPRLVCWDGGEI
jgi:hypothetical protein